ncbi:MAG TPA: hypothetical protein VMW16_16985 [Sedimentisphaerales bacterium]|nr:hypothetical protein [Sedimentisphaerales bacterium]
MLDREKQEWAEKHARRIQQRFEQWQKPLEIDGQEYLKYLIKELAECCDEPLRKSFIESIS